MNSNIDYSLYLVTDRALMKTTTLRECVEQAIQGGVSMVQLREKNISSKAFYEIALDIKEVCRKYDIPFIINDRVDIALAVGADGVHIGQDDLDLRVVTKLLGKDKIIGVSVQNEVQAQEAFENGASYLGVGAMFATKTKDDAKLVSFDKLKKIANQVKIPVVAIGGINKSNLDCFEKTGIAGVALVSAIISNDNVKEKTKEIRGIIDHGFNK